MRVHRRLVSNPGVEGNRAEKVGETAPRAASWSKPDMTSRRHQHRGRTSFVVVLATCWAIGLIGLDGGRTASFQLFVLAGLGLLVVWVVGAVRRAVAMREYLPPPPRVVSRNCVVIRPLGSDEHPSGRA